MGTNSIKSNLTKDSVISEIKLSLGADIGKEKAYIVVEGEDDKKFFNKFFSNNNVKIFESFSGKKGVDEIVCSKEISNDRVIGIQDKDYCKTGASERMFFYDRCCLEMMIIEFDEPFKSIYCEYYRGAMDLNKLKKHILTELAKISNVRKYNEENKKNINFNGLSFDSIIDVEYKLDEVKLIEKLMSLNSGKSIDFSSIFDRTSSMTIEDMLDITNGHDFVRVFKVICDKSYHKKRSPNDKEISAVLRGAFHKELLQKTILYKNINDYFNNRIKVWGFD